MKKPSTADSGFFQNPPVLGNPFYSDPGVRRAFKLFCPDRVASRAGAEIAALGDEVLTDQVLRWVSDAERNKPYLRGEGLDAFGNFRGELVVGEGWRKLQEFGIKRGIVATGYENQYGAYTRVVQFLRLHIWVPSSSMVTCPSAMHDGAACLLQAHLENPGLDPERRKVFENALGHLCSRDPARAWTSGQWMTERSGGSDVSLTETLATHDPTATAKRYADMKEDMPLGPWSVSGFKWFSSATDSNMTVLLAKTTLGVGRLSAFFAPMRRFKDGATSMTGQEISWGEGSELNGVRIQRLKNKFGTQSLPTAELELRDMRAWMIGDEGSGIQEISTVLTVTRIYSAVAAAGYLGRGLCVAKSYAKVREVGGGGVQGRRRMLLRDNALHMRTLADMTAEYRGLMHLCIFSSYILGLSEHKRRGGNMDMAPGPAALLTLTPELEHVKPLLRLLTALTKAYVCKSAVPLLHACMESLGGLGYLLNEEQEHLNLARLYRDCCVLAIWEGTTDVLSADFVRAAKHPRGGNTCVDALDALVRSGMGGGGGGDVAIGPSHWRPLEAWESVRKSLESSSAEELMGRARDLVWSVAEILIVTLLYVDWKSDGNGAAGDVVERFVVVKRLGSGQHLGISEENGSTRLMHDQEIVYGEEVDGRQAKL